MFDKEAHKLITVKRVHNNVQSYISERNIRWLKYKKMKMLALFILLNLYRFFPSLIRIYLK